jgi:hypothetical protein
MNVGECPCKGCVPPKRSPVCHASCKEYIDWAAERQQRLEELREAKYMERVSTPRPFGKSNYKRRNDNGNN